MSVVVDPEVVEEDETVSNITEEVEQETPPEEPELPNKFQGKSAIEIASAYENLEKELGRKGQEIGELRKLTDSILQQQISQPKPETEPTADNDVDFFDDPEAAVRKIINSDPRFKEMQQTTQQQQAAMTAQQLQTTHPDFQEIVQDSGFQEWVQGSKIRQQLYMNADSYDFDSANELLTNWKERQMIAKTQEVEAQKETQRKSALKSGKGVSKASGESTAGKKIYRRADLIRLKQTDPRRYESLQDEILQAYSEGRVK